MLTFLITILTLWQKNTEEIYIYPVTKNSTFLVKEFNPEEYEFQIQCDPKNPKTTKKWKEYSKADYAINGGYFDENNNPVGYVKTNQKTWGHQNWYPNNNQENNNQYIYPAIFNINQNDKIQINYAENFYPKKTKNAIASYPLLIKNKKNNFLKETNKKAKRTIVATKDNKIIFFISNQGRPTLAESSKALSKLKVEKALNLDGGPSTGFSSEHFNIHSIYVPCAILVYKKND